ncbi:hypothetical protein HDIA_2378 [Hartmannibacter diazotrophicus]|uniref:Uncharacterized protein n=1 Tax=Hartmannibacter diazotrophicus TaxID=1482074 RepID=A0A2C9D6W6_9HYPH|nr:hypothetical protein HDIA_2378 [Hartmannibacter diazotrophicus]
MPLSVSASFPELNSGRHIHRPEPKDTARFWNHP